MTVAYDHEALWLKAKTFLNRALEPTDPRSFDEQAMWGSLALELLGKAALSQISPLLIAEPSEEGTNLLIAVGAVSGDGKFVSVRAATIFKRCGVAFRPFNADAAQSIAASRNEYLHGATPGFTTLPEDVWWQQFWRQASILNNAADKSLEDLVGPDWVNAVKSHLAQHERIVREQAEMLIHRARRRKAQHEAGTLPAKIAQRWSPGVTVSTGSHWANVVCPACDGIAVDQGEDVLETRFAESGYFDHDSGHYFPPSVEASVVAQRVSCSSCGLDLESEELISAAGVDEVFDSEVLLEVDYDEPEYGND